jgi:hypothetical protein
LHRFPRQQVVNHEGIIPSLWETKELPNINGLVCTSFFEHPKHKKMVPEVDGYRYVSFAEADERMTNNMARIINQIVRDHGFAGAAPFI